MFENDYRLPLRTQIMFEILEKVSEKTYYISISRI